MCRKCYRKTPQVKEQENRYNVEYLARPTTGPARTNRAEASLQALTLSTEARSQGKTQAAGGRYYHKWYEWRRSIYKKKRTGECAGCGEVKKIQHKALSLCRYCNETRKWIEKYATERITEKLSQDRIGRRIIKKGPRRPKLAEPKPCIKCQTPVAIRKHEMCGKC